MESVRLDAALVQRGICPAREKAKELIHQGHVLVNGVPASKASLLVSEEDELLLDVPPERYVSRGGLKLEGALDAFRISPEGWYCLDLGASTGGFTDCLLQHGAAGVAAVDVGTGQLAESLRKDSRVLSLEKTDFRDLKPDMLPAAVDFVTGDLSFISLKLLFPYLRSFSDHEAVLLIKPQFEAGRADVGKRGVVKDASVHLRVLKEVCAAAELQGFGILGLVPSPIRGQNGNTEYLLHLALDDRPSFDWASGLKETVRRALSDKQQG